MKKLIFCISLFLISIIPSTALAQWTCSDIKKSNYCNNRLQCVWDTELSKCVSYNGNARDDKGNFSVNKKIKDYSNQKKNLYKVFTNSNDSTINTEVPHQESKPKEKISSTPSTPPASESEAPVSTGAFTTNTKASEATLKTNTELKATALTCPSVGGKTKENASIHDIFADGKGNIYVGTDAGLFISTDGGNSFVHKNNKCGSRRVIKVLVDNKSLANKSKIYLATVGGLCTSTDGGNSFIENALNTGYMASSVRLNSKNTIYVGGITWSDDDNASSGLHISTDNGNSFTTRKIVPDGPKSWWYNNVEDVFVDNKDNLYIANGYGLYIYKNGGETFTKKTVADGLGSNTVNRIFVDDKGNIYVGTEPNNDNDGGLSISTNGGASFTNKTTKNGMGDNWVQNIFVKGKNVYVATGTWGLGEGERYNKGGGLSISKDGGNTFTNKTFPNQHTANAVFVDSTGTIYAGNGGPEIYTSKDAGGPEIYISKDDGNSFTKVCLKK